MVQAAQPLGCSKIYVFGQCGRQALRYRALPAVHFPSHRNDTGDRRHNHTTTIKNQASFVVHMLDSNNLYKFDF